MEVKVLFEPGNGGNANKGIEKSVRTGIMPSYMKRLVRTPSRVFLFCWGVLLVAAALVSCRTAGPHYTRPRPKEIPDAITQAVREQPRENFPRLVAFIRERADTDREAFRYAHDWVARNITYDYAVYEGAAERVDEPYEVIANGKAVCEGYARTLELLCGELGIECPYVVGYVRGGSTAGPREASLRSPEDAGKARHAWNAVELDGRWHLVDVTYNAGWYRNEDGLAFNYTHSYYLSTPQHFIYTHFPDDERWQLLDEPLSFEEFKTLPEITPGFFQYGLELVGSHVRATTVTESTYSIRVDVPDDVRLNGILTKSAAAPETVYRNHELVTIAPDGVHTFNVRFPGPGDYVFHLVAKHKAGDDHYRRAASYHFKVPNGAEAAGPYPTVYDTFRDYRIHELDPSARVLDRVAYQTFSFTTDVRRPYFLVVPNVGRYAFSLNRETGRYEATVPLDGEEAYLAVKRGDRYHYLVEYLVE